MQVNTILKHVDHSRNWLAVVGTVICLGVSSAGAQKAQVKAVISTPKPVSSGVADQKAVNSFFRAVVAAKITAKNKGDSKPTVKDEAWELPDEWCVAMLGYPKGKSLEGCMVYAVSNHTAAMIHATLYCESEHCENEFYLMSGLAGPRRLAGDVYGPWVLSPDRKSLFLGDTGMGVDDNGQFTGTYEASLTRIDVQLSNARPRMPARHRYSHRAKNGLCAAMRKGMCTKCQQMVGRFCPCTGWIWVKTPFYVDCPSGGFATSCAVSRYPANDH